MFDINKAIDLSKTRVFVTTNHQEYDQTAKDDNVKYTPFDQYKSFKSLKVKCGKISFSVARNNEISKNVKFGKDFGGSFVICNSDLAAYTIIESTVNGGSLDDITGFELHKSLTKEDFNKKTIYIGTTEHGNPSTKYPCEIDSVDLGSITANCKNLPNKVISGTPIFLSDGSDSYLKSKELPIVIGVLKSVVNIEGNNLLIVETPATYNFIDRFFAQKLQPTNPQMAQIAQQ
jgi:hypothetical protein